MGFKSISTDKYIELHLKSNPKEDEAGLRERLANALNDFQNGIKCACGEDIWVIGSASVGNTCFTCLTGESNPNEDYEIDLAMNKRESPKGRRHIDDIDPTKIGGFFDDDGYEINTELIQKPSLCITCAHNSDSKQELFCNMTRYDQRNDDEFKCYTYRKAKM